MCIRDRIKLGQSVGAMNTQGLMMWREQLERATVAEEAELIRTCKVNKMYDQAKQMIILHLHHPELREYILSSCKQVGYELKQSRPPRELWSASCNPGSSPWAERPAAKR
eukprot:1520338-Amphidinium_carterae.1